MRLRVLSLIPLLFFPALLAAAPSPDGGEDMGSRCAVLAGRWQRRFNSENLGVLIAPPFVIAGDLPHDDLLRYRDDVLLPASHALHAQFFESPPETPILSVLLAGGRRYRNLARRWFGNEDTEDVGYYTADDRESSLILDTSSGDGTVVHELTHALIDPDFPDVPDWFNEGLASLFEDYTLTGGRITGRSGARLPELQEAIGESRLRPMSELIEDRDFYRTDLENIQDYNYAQARFLMYYLQEKGLLTRYYRQFRDHAAQDPTGIDTLRDVLRPKTLDRGPDRGMDEIDRHWRAWAMDLRDDTPRRRRRGPGRFARRSAEPTLLQFGRFGQTMQSALGLQATVDPSVQRAHLRALEPLTLRQEPG